MKHVLNYLVGFIVVCQVCTSTSAQTPVVNEDFKLLASDGAIDDEFGYSVSISSDGSTAIVGARYDDDNGLNSGSAYIYRFDGSTWSEEVKLTASDGASSDYFGTSVSISSDGSTVIVGAYGDDDNGSYSGSAYIYELVSGVWQETKLTASDGVPGDTFGYSVSVSSDGFTVIAGAVRDDDNGTDSGSAYIYSLVQGAWEETKLIASDGASVDRFGISVSISSDGSTAIVGAHWDDDNGIDSGSAYIYSLVQGVWEETKLLASDGASGDYFGVSVSISNDGSAAIVGARYDDDNGTDSGSAYIYSLVQGVWEEIKLTASDGASGDLFGVSVSISNDGSTAIVGAYWDDNNNGSFSGSAYIYSLVQGVWEETKLLASDGASGDQFGVSVSIPNDGSTAIVGAYQDDDNGNNTGSAYMFYFAPPDTDGDGIPDSIDNCYLYNPDQADCNNSGIGDICDIADQTSFDCDQNDVPDECQPDCDNDGVPDSCELDCNENGIPDDCDIIFGFSQDCNANGIPDECDIATDLALDCDTNGLIDSCEILDNPTLDCNDNGVLDACDIANGASFDVNVNGVPDECEVDCNGNSIPDLWEIKTGQAEDCNMNLVPDECDIADQTSNDINTNGVPDECEPDCNNNGIPDDWDITIGLEDDCNGNGVPDSCDVNDPANDQNGNGIPDECECAGDINLDGVVNIYDLLSLIGDWGNTTSISDLNADGIVDVNDLLILIGAWGSCA